MGQSLGRTGKTDSEQDEQSGQTELLKERTLGIEIFGRDATCDTATDPIVRVTAAEIRKRIAQYYQEPGHEKELRVSLPPGSYVPQFHWPSSTAPVGPAGASTFDAAAMTGQMAAPVEIPAAGAAHEEPKRRSRVWFVPGLVLAVLMGAAAVLGWKTIEKPRGVNNSWVPVLNSGDPVLFCIADQNQYSAISLRDAADPSRQITLRDNLTAVVIDDLSLIVRIAGLLQSSGKRYSLRGEDATNLMDLRSGPTVLIGAFDNAWTLRLTKSLRYHFANNADMTELRIVDASAPEQKHWEVNRLEQMTTNNYRDYALVARFTDPTTGKLAVVAAGIGRGGTIAAGEFLTDAGNLAQLQHIAESAGPKNNMEMVLSTQVIDGESGTPHVEATYLW